MTMSKRSSRSMLVNGSIRWRVVSFLAALLLTFGCTLLPPTAAAPESTRPRLAVLVFFDQLRGDYLSRWHELFVEDGFRRLAREGAWYQNCHYDYANTFTGSGHASVVCGCPPEKHAIVGNEWYERSTRGYVHCISANRYEKVP